MHDMFQDTSNDTLTFINVFISCQIICVIFDFIRTKRHKRNMKTSFLAFEDALFCLIAFYIFFKTIYLSNGFELRWYQFLSSFISVCLYFMYESKFVIIFCHKAVDFIFEVILKVKKVFSFFPKCYSKVKKASSKKHKTDVK